MINASSNHFICVCNRIHCQSIVASAYRNSAKYSNDFYWITKFWMLCERLGVWVERYGKFWEDRVGACAIHVCQVRYGNKQHKFVWIVLGSRTWKFECLVGLNVGSEVGPDVGSEVCLMLGLKFAWCLPDVGSEVGPDVGPECWVWSWAWCWVWRF